MTPGDDAHDQAEIQADRAEHHTDVAGWFRRTRLSAMYSSTRPHLREFRGDVMLVVINNGREDMPGPVTLQIGANRNVPPRIKILLEGSTLHSQTAGVADVIVQDGLAAVQVPGKTAGMFTL